ncbi:hypothetical protein ACFL1X_01145 [Candidatus Hydrogenedentota bacterium]
MMQPKNIVIAVVTIAVIGVFGWGCKGKGGDAGEKKADSAATTKKPSKKSISLAAAKKIKDDNYEYEIDVNKKEVKDPLESMKRYKARKKKEAEEAELREREKTMSEYLRDNPPAGISLLDLLALNAVIFDAQGNSLAIIDHSLVREGYLLENGARVERIDSDSVKVSLSGDERILLLEQEY